MFIFLNKYLATLIITIINHESYKLWCYNGLTPVITSNLNGKESPHCVKQWHFIHLPVHLTSEILETS